MKHIFKKICSAVLVTSVMLAQTAVGGASAFAAEAEAPVGLRDNGLAEEVEGGAILHCWCQSFNTIRDNIPEIAAAGFSAIQTSPICEVNNGGDGSLTISGGDNWWWHYQPTDYKIGNYQFGTRDEFKAMCDTAHEYGIKVIVDSVLNHTTAYYDKISENIKSIPGGAFHPMGDEREPGQNWSETDRYEETQYDLSGLYELNTQNKEVQNYILSFLEDCVACGADGFRYDAAKLIELPDDTSEKYGNDFASDFWPTILQNGSAFQYGEVLQEGGNHSYSKDSSGYNDNDSSRLYAYQSQSFTDNGGKQHYMNTTNSYTGFRIRDAIANKNLDADFVTDALLPEGARADRTVTWVESHDNYCNDKSYSELTEVQQVIQAWALIAARKDGTPLFFDRPNNSTASNPWGDNKIGPEGSDMYKDPQVVAVNFFRNEMNGTPQSASNPVAGNNQVVMIERGDRNKGVVIVNAGDTDVTISAPTGMSDGAYTDQAYSGSFNVSGGIISGTVKAGKVAVVYNSEIDSDSRVACRPAVSLSVGSGYYLTDTLTVEAAVRSCDRAEYTLVIDGDTAGAVTREISAGGTILIENVPNNKTAVLTLTGYDSGGNALASVTKEYTRWIKQDNTIAYMDSQARPGWTKCYAYIWGSSENASWPGVEMELTEHGLYRYILPYQYEIAGSNGNVIFNNGSGEQFDAGAITAGQQMIYTAGGQWKPYSSEEYSRPSVNLSEPSGYLVTDNAKVTALIRNCDHAAYTVVKNGAEVASGAIDNNGVISLDMLGHKEEVTVTLKGYDSNNREVASATATYTGWQKQNNTVIYMEKAAKPGWTKCYAYIWGSSENASWPGEEMEDTGDGLFRYVLPYQFELDGSNGNVIFHNGSGQQFDAGRITPGQQMIYTADGKWIPYEEPERFTMGDANLDGIVNVTDATTMQRAVAQFITLDSKQQKVADVDSDGDVTIADITCVQKYLAEHTGGYGTTGTQRAV